MFKLRTVQVSEGTLTTNLPHTQILITSTPESEIPHDSATVLLNNLVSNNSLDDPNLKQIDFVKLVKQSVIYDPMYNWHDSPIPVEVTLDDNVLVIR